MSSNLPNLNPANYIGVRATNPPQQYPNMQRAPTTSDYQNFFIGDEWLDRSASPPDWWKLVDKAQNIATWIKIGNSGTITSLTGDDAVSVNPVAGNINIQGGASGAISFTSGGAGQMNAQVLVDGVSVNIVGNQLVAAGGGNPIQTINTIAPDGLGNFTINAGSNIVITPGLNSISIASTGNLNWVEVALNTLMVLNTGYIVNAGGVLTMVLPAAASQGDVIEIQDKGVNGFVIQASAGDTVVYQGISSTVGGGWSTVTTGCYAKLLCVTANSRWDIITSQGNFLSF